MYRPLVSPKTPDSRPYSVPFLDELHITPSLNERTLSGVAMWCDPEWERFLYEESEKEANNQKFPPTPGERNMNA